jgi:hypothetical protein
MPVPTKHEISDYDFQIIITSVMEEFQKMSNPTTDGFEAIYRSSMRCYLRGRNIDFTSFLLAEVMSLVADEARHEEQYAAFCRWVERTHEDAVARALLDWGEDGPRCECAHPKCGDGKLWCGCDICSEWYTDECYCRHWEETDIDDEESWVP